MRRPRDIFSRSERLNASLQRLRSGGQMPPVGEITEKTEDDWRSNIRPIELIDFPRCHLSLMSDFCLSVKNMRRRYFMFITPSLAKD
jgi:hypothetical protein